MGEEQEEHEKVDQDDHLAATIVPNKKSLCCEQCPVLPIFGDPIDKRPRFCTKHKLPGMIDLKNKRCIQCRDKIPSFNHPGEKRPQFCRQCKTDGMIDVRNKPCRQCSKIPTYNYPGEKMGHYCQDHQLPGMIDVRNPVCPPPCGKYASFNHPCARRGLYCFQHKDATMTNVLTKRCRACQVVMGNRKYDGYCCRCYMIAFPQHTMSRNYKIKERAVVEYVMKSFPDLAWMHDRRIEAGTSAHRPDLWVDLRHFVLCIEVDEDGHRQYNECDEQLRLERIAADVQFRPLVVLRINPDGYQLDHPPFSKIKSCWAAAASSLSLRDVDQWNHRMQVLCDHIVKWMDISIAQPHTVEDGTIHITHLFFTQTDARILV